MIPKVNKNCLDTVCVCIWFDKGSESIRKTSKDTKRKRSNQRERSVIVCSWKRKIIFPCRHLQALVSMYHHPWMICLYRRSCQSKTLMLIIVLIFHNACLHHGRSPADDAMLTEGNRNKRARNKYLKFQYFACVCFKYIQIKMLILLFFPHSSTTWLIQNSDNTPKNCFFFVIFTRTS